MRRWSRILAVVILLANAAAACQAPAPPPAPPPAAFPTVELFEAYPNLSFSQPLEFVAPAAAGNRVFILEKGGRMFSFDNDPAAKEAALFLDLRPKVTSAGFEQGLLGAAFHPRFAENGLLYVSYTASSGSVVAEYRVDPQDPLRALPGSERVILTVRQPYGNHNGGHIAFGPDGFLYLGLGDGGSAGDPQGNAQNMGSLLGKLLRIDVDRAQGSRAYAIPADNPWAGNQLGYREEVFALGFRNPWKFSFDPVTGKLWVADVGQDAVEEIDIVASGRNYGWNTMEGSQCYPPGRECSKAGLDLPVWEYRHPTGQSITGGYVYRGTSIEGLKGYYIYGDYVTGRVWALRIDESGNADNRLLLESGLRIASFGVDQNSEIYVVDLRGKIYRLRRVTR